MEFDPLPPPDPTLTLTPNPNIPPDIPPDPSLSMLFPENTPYRVPDNPFRDSTSKRLREVHKITLQNALASVRGPFLFNPVEPYAFNGACVGVDITAESFNSAVITVIAALERGYCPNRDPAPLGTSDWARLSSALLAAVGRGYHRQFTPDQEAALEKTRAEATDPSPLTSAYPTFFHRLSVTAEEVAFHIGTDAREQPTGYQDWYSTLKIDFTKKATKAAAAEVDEKWLTWKANEIDRLAETYKKDLGTKAREKGKDYFIETAEKLGLQILRTETPTPTAGRKRTASGSRPKPTQSASVTPKATRQSLPRAAKGTPSSSPAPRGRQPGPTPQPTTRVDPSPTPGPKKKILDTSRPNPQGDGLTQTSLPRPSQTPDQPDSASLTATVLTKILARLEALEKRSMPPPVSHTKAQNRPTSVPTIPREENNPHSTSVETPPATQTTEREDDFTLVARNRRGRKGKDKAPPQINLTPASYASAAASSANITQPAAPPKPATRLPAITEVTVLRSGSEGHPDPQVEMSIRARPADAIVREVRLKMANAVPNPIPLRAGRWSSQLRSKGNFVYSFDGNIPFDLMKSYERILLTPFFGTGKLSPSMGWTRLLAHGVPVFDEYQIASGPEALLKEARSLPGLKKAHFAMPPRWLKPIERIGSLYSSVTFAISDPDGSITSTLLNGRAALFGKEVNIQRWVDKPALVQCSKCHALGHIKTSRACPLGKDSVKCYICGGSHLSDVHDQKCPRKHEVAGICDCGHFKCLNCHNKGHNCRDTRCPARDLFRPRTSRKQRKHKNSGKATGGAPEAGPSVTTLDPLTEDPFAYISDSDDLYAPVPPPSNLTRRQARTEQHHQGIDNIVARLNYDSFEFPEAWNCDEDMDTDFATAGPLEYSPSRPQGDATNTSLA